MSLDTWCKEFYVRPANTATKDDLTALQHSLQKWRGLNPSNLKRHGIMREGTNIVDKNDKFMLIDISTCSLCQRYVVPYDGCNGCPVSDAGYCCDHQNSPWEHWYCDHDPKPMIKLLIKLTKQCRDEITKRLSAKTTSLFRQLALGRLVKAQHPINKNNPDETFVITKIKHDEEHGYFVAGYNTAWFHEDMVTVEK